MSESELKSTDERIASERPNWAVFRDHPNGSGIAYIRESGSKLYQKEVCVVFGDADRPGTAELLAAAPDLLAVVRQVVTHISPQGPHSEIFDAALEAITKAEKLR